MRNHCTHVFFFPLLFHQCPCCLQVLLGWVVPSLVNWTSGQCGEIARCIRHVCLAFLYAQRLRKDGCKTDPYQTSKPYTTCPNTKLPAFFSFDHFAICIFMSTFPLESFTFRLFLLSWVDYHKGPTAYAIEKIIESLRHQLSSPYSVSHNYNSAIIGHYVHYKSLNMQR